MTEKSVLSIVIISVAALLLWANNRMNSDGRTVLRSIADSISGANNMHQTAQPGGFYTPPGSVSPVTVPPPQYKTPQQGKPIYDMWGNPVTDKNGNPVKFNSLYSPESVYGTA